MRWEQRRPLVITASLVTVAAFGLWLLLWSGVFGLSSVKVSGTSRLTNAQVLAAAGLRPGTPLVSLDIAAVRRRIAALPPVAAVEVHRDWPSTVRIVIRERQARAVVVTDAGLRLVDRAGVAFAAVASQPALLPRITVDRSGPGPGSGPDPAVRAAVAVLDALPGPLQTQVVGLSAASAESVQLTLKGHRQVVWGSVRDSARKAAVLAALLSRPAHVYDVSAPGVAVTR